MKKSIIFVVLTVGLMLAPAALAAQFYSGDQVQLSDKATLMGNTYAAGGTVNIDTPVQGDLFVAGGTVRITAPVTGDLFVSGGNVTVEGPVAGDLRMAGGSVVVAGQVKGETMVSGGDVAISSVAQVNEVWVGAGQLTVAGTTGAMHAATGQLTVSDGAHIAGVLSYMSDTEAAVAEGAQIDGKVTRTAPPEAPMKAKAPLVSAVIGGSVLWFVSGLIMLLLFAYLMPNKALFLAKDWRANFGVNLLWGIIGLIVAPVVAFLLLISVVGIPLGVGLMIVYAVTLYFAKLVVAVAVGIWVKSWWMKGAVERVDWLAVLIGFAVVTVVALIPFLGGLAMCVAFVGAVGAVMRNDWALVQKLRLSKDF